MSHLIVSKMSRYLVAVDRYIGWAVLNSNENGILGVILQ